MSEAGDPALIGRRIAGKFVVEKFLGGGAMGAVYRARDESLDRNVALKVMHPAMAVDPSFVSRFHREARAASRLEHPNSMRVIEFGEEPDGLLYIAMEYLEGRDLYRVIHEDWPLSDARVADILMKALAALAVAHEMGVIHRDLKPENFMILDRKDDDGADLVKVCDFGIAKITEKDDTPGAPPRTAGQKVTTAGLVVGTPEYMSPEQARGEKLDARSDLYSTGILLYQLLTGRTPFLAETALAVVLKHINEPPAPPSSIYPDVHKGLEAVCLRSIAKKPEDRFQSARDMRAAIREAIEGRPITASASAPPGPRSNAPGPMMMRTAPMPALDVATATGIVRAADGTSKMTPLATADVGSREDGPRTRRTSIVGVALLALALGVGGALYFGGIFEPPAPAPAPEPLPAAHPSASVSESGSSDRPSPSSVDVRLTRPAESTRTEAPRAPKPSASKSAGAEHAASSASAADGPTPPTQSSSSASSSPSSAASSHSGAPSAKVSPRASSSPR